MISMNMKTFRFGAALWAIGFAGGTAAWAQEVRHVYGTSQLREDHGQTLSRHLRTLAESPRNSSALRGAGEAALSLGDPQTALTFSRGPRRSRLATGECRRAWAPPSYCWSSTPPRSASSASPRAWVFPPNAL